jgi:hypothetical protein
MLYILHMGWGKPMICQRCGSSIQPENKFCPNCGTTLDAPAQAGDPTSPAHAAGQFVPESGKKRSIVKILVIVGAIFIILALAGAVGVFFGVRYLLKSSAANRAAVAALRQSRAASEALGEITSVGIPMGNISSNGDGSGHASLSMSVKGTRASGVYYAKVDKLDEARWVVASGRLQLSDGRSIALDLPGDLEVPGPKAPRPRARPSPPPPISLGSNRAPGEPNLDYRFGLKQSGTVWRSGLAG